METRALRLTTHINKEHSNGKKSGLSQRNQKETGQNHERKTRRKKSEEITSPATRFSYPLADERQSPSPGIIVPGNRTSPCSSLLLEPVEYFSPMERKCPRYNRCQPPRGMVKMHVLAKPGSWSSKAAALLTRGAYTESVSTAKGRERRWRLFSTFPANL